MPGFHFPFSVCANSAAPWFGWGARGDAADALLWACVPKVRCQPVSRTAGADQWSPLRCVCTVSVGEGSPLPLLGVSTLLPVGRSLLPPPFAVIKSLTAGAYEMLLTVLDFSRYDGRPMVAPTGGQGTYPQCSHKPGRGRRPRRPTGQLTMFAQTKKGSLVQRELARECLRDCKSVEFAAQKRKKFLSGTTPPPRGARHLPLHRVGSEVRRRDAR